MVLSDSRSIASVSIACALVTAAGVQEACPFPGLWERLVGRNQTMAWLPLSCLPGAVTSSLPAQAARDGGALGCRICAAHVVEGFPVIVYDGCFDNDVISSQYRRAKGMAYERRESDRNEFAEHRTSSGSLCFNTSDCLKAQVEGYGVDPVFPASVSLGLAMMAPWCRPEERYVETYRAYINALNFGDSAFAHIDTEEGGEDTDHAFFTALYYPNTAWEVNWGGETTFFTGKDRLPVPEAVSQKVELAKEAAREAYVNALKESYAGRPGEIAADVPHSPKAQAAKDALVALYGEEQGEMNRDGEVAIAVLPRRGRLVLFDSRVRHTARPPNRVVLETRYTLALKMKCWRLTADPARFEDMERDVDMEQATAEDKAVDANEDEEVREDEDVSEL